MGSYDRRQFFYNQIVAADPSKATEDIFNGDLETTYYSLVNAGQIPSSSGVTAQHTANLLIKLQQNQEDAGILVLGDSTGASTTRWPYLITQFLAGQFPAYTVKYQAWNDTNQNYDPAVTIQTGTGPHTLTMYNGSMSGSIFSYPYATSTRWGAIAPTPSSGIQLVFVNFGHNNTGITTTYSQYPLLRGLGEKYPRAGLVCILQNPRVSTDTEYSNDLIRQRVIMDMCTAEGFGCINVTQVFLNTPNYAATLLNADGLHPSDAAGSPAWAKEIQRFLIPNPHIVPAGANWKDTRFFVPATSFMAETGAPVLTLVNSDHPAWPLAHASTQGVVATVDIPTTWNTWDVIVLWSHVTSSGLTSGNNSAKFEVGNENQGPAITEPFDGLVGNHGSSFNVVTMIGNANNAGGSYPTQFTRVPSSYSGGLRPVGFRVRRLGADAADTLTDAANFMGLLIVRTD